MSFSFREEVKAKMKAQQKGSKTLALWEEKMNEVDGCHHFSVGQYGQAPPPQ